MNSLSWLLYWADVLPSVSTWLAFISFLLFVLALALIGIGFGLMEDASNIDKKYNHSTDKYESCVKEDLKRYKNGIFVRRLGFCLAPLFFILWGASFMVPEKETFYLIAGSEAGERALQTPEFSKVRAVINKYLDDQLPSDDKDKADTDKKD